MHRNYKLYIFDYDDTLVQTHQTVIDVHYPLLAKQLGCQYLGENIVRKYWGRKLEESLTAIFKGDFTVEQASNALFQIYEKIPIPPAKGAIRILEILKKYGKFLCISSTLEFNLLEMGIQNSLNMKRDSFDFIISSPKPSETIITLVKEEYEKSRGTIIENKDILYIGDSIKDYLTVKHQGIDFIGITTGINTKEDFLELGLSEEWIFSSLKDAIQAPPSHGIVALIQNEKGQFLFVKEARKHNPFYGGWSGPHGRCMEEDIIEEETVVRECYEECQLHVKPIRKVFERRADTKVKTVAFWEARIINKMEKVIANPREISEIKWVTFEEIISGALPLYPGTRDYFENYYKKKKVGRTEIQEKLLINIVKELKNKRCVIFFGSGVSAGSDLPTGQDLAKRLISDFPDIRDMEDISLKEAAQIVAYKHGKEKYAEVLKDIILEKSSKPNDLHKVIALLNVKYYVTTNYDKLFDKVLEKIYDIREDQIIVNDDDIINAGEVIYIKLHGDINLPETMVLTANDYRTREKENPVIFSLLESLFARNIVVFIGYSLKDENVLAIIRNIKYSLGRYIFLINPTTKDRALFASENIQIVDIVTDDENPTNEEKTEKTLELLMDIWKQTLNFNIYIDMKPFKATSYAARLEFIIYLYRQAEFQEAYNQIISLERDFFNMDSNENINHIWMEDPGSYTQHTYFKLKVLDKLDRWDEVRQEGEKVIKWVEMLETVYPPEIIRSIQSQVYFSIGSSLSRIDFQGAAEYLDIIIKNRPSVDLVGEEGMISYGDKLVVSSIVSLNLHYFHEQDLDLAIKKLSEVKVIFEKYACIDDDEKEIHYCGRYFGALTFVKIAEIRKNTELDAFEIKNFLLKSAKKSHNNGKRRFAFGILAGKYCEAVLNLFLAFQSQIKTSKTDSISYYEKCISILKDECLKIRYKVNDDDPPIKLNMDRLTSWTRAKIYRVLLSAYKGLNSLSNEGIYDKKIEKCELRFLRELDNLQIDEEFRLGVVMTEDWVFTPLI
ncbi:MAG: SIR2 family protein [Candidatus Hermodarchaeota archaeon]